MIRHVLRVAALLGIAVLAARVGAQASADAYLDDARTLRGVSFAAPRYPLRLALAELSRATEVGLSAAPELAEASLVGEVPREALREIMHALAELYDAEWRAAGEPPAYVLTPTPESLARAAEERRRVIDEAIVAIDTAAAMDPQVDLPPQAVIERARALALRVWRRVPKADQRRLLLGEPVTLELAAATAPEIVPLLDRIGLSRDEAVVTGPVRADLDLDDQADTAVPILRVRVIAPVTTGFIGEQARYDFFRALPVPPERLVAAFVGEPIIGTEPGNAGTFSGLRDEITRRFALEVRLPVLSRHRAKGGGSAFAGDGIPISRALSQLGRALEADPELTQRGFALFRSRTAAWDALGQTPTTLAERVAAGRPPVGKPFTLEQIAPLAVLTPIELGILSRGNRAAEAADYVREVYGPCRFFLTLTPEQRQQLRTNEGLALEGLPLPTLQLLLEDSAHRGDLRLDTHLTRIVGLRIRYEEQQDDEERIGIWRLERDNVQVEGSTIPLPIAEEIEPLAARRFHEE